MKSKGNTGQIKYQGYYAGCLSWSKAEISDTCSFYATIAISLTLPESLVWLRGCLSLAVSESR